MAKYSLGIDYGTLSGRAVLVNVTTGEEIADASYEYPHGVMDEKLPCGTKLPPDYALQYPMDYIEVIKKTVPEILKKSKVSPDDIIGIGTDFTACTVLPVLGDGTPLCYLDENKGNPHAYVKLWKHHAAQPHANKLNEIAAKMGEKWIARYGGKVSSEWAFPKLMQIAEEAPEIYDQMAHFVEASDWIVWQLCGVQTRNSCCAGYKSFWHKKDGFPSKEFFKALNPKMENVIADKYKCEVSPLGDRAGGLTKEMAEITGLNEGTAVAVGNVDAHVCVPAVKIDGVAKMLAIMGTSTCHMILGKTEERVNGICGVVEDGILPGFFGYEAGQSCVGDHFAWFIENCLPADYYNDAEQKGMNIHKYLREKAQKLEVGESGLIALDWWNGNRSCLVDADLSGMMLGMTLQTKPEEIYRALIEATAYGTKMIIENFKKHGVIVEEFYAAGGISQKDAMTMQIYADIINMPVFIAGSEQGPALGSAIFGAVAAGEANGGYDSVISAAKIMGKLKDISYRPIQKNAERYQKLFEEYEILHDYFGRGANDVMKRLKAMKNDIINN